MPIGKVLIIPPNLGTNPNNMFMYKVKLGDTLYSIAKKYNTTVSAIKDLNYLTDNALKVGEEIRIPETYTKEDEMTLPNYINYVVKVGDTLYSIAKNNNISIDVLIKDNSLENNNLKLGQNLKIRIMEDNFYIEECIGEDYIPQSTVNNFITYTVKKGDSLYKIAQKYNITVSAIQNLNGLKNTNLFIGQTLKIPIDSKESTTYVVKSGDNLYSIAKKFGLSVDSIKKNNKLNSNLLSIGQKLII